MPLSEGTEVLVAFTGTLTGYLDHTGARKVVVSGEWGSSEIWLPPDAFLHPVGYSEEAVRLDAAQALNDIADSRDETGTFDPQVTAGIRYSADVLRTHWPSRQDIEDAERGYEVCPGGQECVHGSDKPHLTGELADKGDSDA